MLLRRSHRLPILVVVWILLAILPIEVAQAESWTNLRGTRTIEAKLIGIWGEHVLLRLPDGKRVSVAMDDLRSDSRIKAKKLFSEITEYRQARAEEFKQKTEVLAAPAPDPIPTPRSASDYSPPPADSTLQVFLDSVHESQADGHWRVVYDALPPSSRELVNAATKDIIESLGKDQVVAMASALQRLGTALVDKQNWLQRSPRVRSEDDEGNEFIDEFVLPLGGLLKEGFRPEVLDFDALATGDWPSVLDKLDPAIAPYAYQITEFAGLDTPAFFIVEKDAEGTLTENAAADQSEQRSGSQELIQQQWVKADGVWTPKDHAETFPKSIESVKEQCADGGPASFALSGFTTAVEAVAAPMLSAKTEEEYHVAIENHLLLPLTTVTGLIGEYGGGTNDDDRDGFGG